MALVAAVVVIMSVTRVHPTMFFGPRPEELLAAAENFGNLEQCQSKTTNTLCRMMPPVAGDLGL